MRAAATPYRIFYSRKNFLFPDKQHGPHRSWKQEVRYLDDMFEGGSAYMVGKMNGDHWYLYITSPNNTLTPPRTPVSETGLGGGGGGGGANSHSASPCRGARIPTGLLAPSLCGKDYSNDETLEILMTDLDAEHAKQFYLSHASAVASERVPAQALLRRAGPRPRVSAAILTAAPASVMARTRYLTWTTCCSRGARVR